jgi:hypothetical protein
VWETCRELIPSRGAFAFLAEHRDELFPAGMFADMHPSPNGRPGMPPQVLAVVVALQALRGLPDYEAAQAVRCDLRWKAACGLGQLDAGFGPSLLAYFLRRMARSGDPGRLFSKGEGGRGGHRGAGREAPAGAGLHGPRRRGGTSGTPSPSWSPPSVG